jgi:hypothetical protein
MTDADLLRGAFTSLEVNPDFTEAVLGMRDGSRLLFCHRVGRRWARADPDGGEAARVLARMALFRLNARHLDVRFGDGSRWEAPFGGPGSAG